MHTTTIEDIIYVTIFVVLIAIASVGSYILGYQHGQTPVETCTAWAADGWTLVEFKCEKDLDLNNK